MLRGLLLYTSLPEFWSALRSIFFLTNTTDFPKKEELYIVYNLIESMFLFSFSWLTKRWNSFENDTSILQILSFLYQNNYFPSQLKTYTVTPLTCSFCKYSTLASNSLSCSLVGTLTSPRLWAGRHIWLQNFDSVSLKVFNFFMRSCFSCKEDHTLYKVHFL